MNQAFGFTRRRFLQGTTSVAGLSLLGSPMLLGSAAVARRAITRLSGLGIG